MTARAFDYALFFPSDEADLPPRVLQLPIIRVPAQGRIGVPIFAFLTGFVCALKPLKLSQHRSQHSEALAAVAKSAFRRPLRLFFPATIATAISFLCTALGGYTSAASSDSTWVRFDAPIQEPTFRLEVCRLFEALLMTWTTGVNVYDRHQWALKPLLIGAFQVYILVALMVGMRLKYRLILHSALMMYWWLNTGVYTGKLIQKLRCAAQMSRATDSEAITETDTVLFIETFGSMITLGSLLADLSLHRPTQNLLAAHHRVLSLVVAPALVLLGLLFGSYPKEHEEYSDWSHWLHESFVKTTPEGQSVGSLIIPEGTDPPRRFTSAAVQLCAIAMFLSPMLREALSHRWLLWLGQHSFAVYLLHGTILRSIGIWVAYGLRPDILQTQEDGSRRGYMHVRSETYVYGAIVVFIAVSYASAWAWMRWADVACARATRWVEDLVFQNGDGQETMEKVRSGEGYDGVHKLIQGSRRMRFVAAEANSTVLPL